MVTTDRGYAAVALCSPKTPDNVGGVMRAVHCYKAAMVLILGGMRYGHSRKARSRMDVYSTYKHVPVIELFEDTSIIPTSRHNYDLQIPNCETVVVELVDGAKSLADFKHPERALYIFGPEDGSVPKVIREKADHVVYIPTQGCMNLAACDNVVLYDRLAKQRRQ